MKRAKLKQFAASILVVLSLLVSSVSACTCAHSSSPRAETSEHHEPQIQQHSHGIETGSHHSHRQEAATHRHGDRAEKGAAALSFSETECCCIKPAPKALAKSETIKTQKQAVRIFPRAQVEIHLAPQIVSVETSEFAAPFYLADSFHNLAPGRAPPRL